MLAVRMDTLDICVRTRTRTHIAHVLRECRVVFVCCLKQMRAPEGFVSFVFLLLVVFATLLLRSPCCARNLEPSWKDGFQVSAGVRGNVLETLFPFSLCRCSVALLSFVTWVDVVARGYNYYHS